MPSHAFSSSNLLRAIGQWDLAGVGVSVACVVHCVAPPLLVLLIPATGVAWLSDPTLGWVFVGIAASIAIAALGAGFARHRRREPLMLGLVGLVVMAMGHGLASSSTWEMVAGGAGGAALITAHLRNRALIRAAARCHCSACAADPGDAVDASPGSIIQGSSAVGP